MKTRELTIVAPGNYRYRGFRIHRGELLDGTPVYRVRGKRGESMGKFPSCHAAGDQIDIWYEDRHIALTYVD